jgi:hypothetical protein
MKFRSTKFNENFVESGRGQFGNFSATHFHQMFVNIL